MSSSLRPQVLLIGGSSSVGKTTLARALARRLDGEHVQVDDLRRNVDDPRAHFLAQTRHPWRLEPSALCLALQRAAEAMRPLLGRVLDAALANGRGLVLEGEGLDPWLAARYSSEPRVCALFVVELDVKRLASTLHARSLSFRRLPAAEQVTVARTGALYGAWLKGESRERGLPCLPSQPWATLRERAARIPESGDARHSLLARERGLSSSV